MRYRCDASNIDPRLRESLCGRKRVCQTFPCIVCELRKPISVLEGKNEVKNDV